MFVTWLGEQITEKGIGNGVSMIIFAGIISRLPQSIKDIYDDYFVNIDSSDLWKSVIFVVILLIAIVLIVVFVTYFPTSGKKNSDSIYKTSRWCTNKQLFTAKSKCCRSYSGYLCQLIYCDSKCGVAGIS